MLTECYLDEMISDLKRIVEDLNLKIIDVDTARGMVCGYRECHGDFGNIDTEHSLRGVLDFVLDKPEFQSRILELIGLLEQEPHEKDEDDDDDYGDCEDSYQELYYDARANVMRLKAKVDEQAIEIERLKDIIRSNGKVVPMDM